MASVNRRKTRTKKDEKIIVLENHLRANSVAIAEGAKKKTFTLHDLKSVKPLTFSQQRMFESYFDGNNIVASGSAGTGKSFIACYLALTDVLNKTSKQKRIIIVRSAVPSREIGFTPGDENEKMAPYEAPYRDIFTDLLGKWDAYDTLKDTKVLDFYSTSFVRGLTWDDAVIIIDEMQSCNFHEIASVLTRCGDNSKVIAIGDNAQNDLIYKKNDTSGMPRFLRVAEKMNDFDIINFQREDIVRSKFVKSFILACEETPE